MARLTNDRDELVRLKKVYFVTWRAIHSFYKAVGWSSRRRRHAPLSNRQFYA